MRNFWIIAAAVCLSAGNAWAVPKGVIVLVPGTGNVLLPGGLHFDHPYFSDEIIDAVGGENYEVHVIRDLEPFGAIEANGESALQELTQWYHARFPAGGVPIELVGHSAGGLYALEMAAHADPKLPIRAVVGVAAPFEGTELADIAFHQNPLGPEAEDLLDKVSNVIDFRGLADMTTDRVAKFMASIRLRPGIRVYSVASAQSRPEDVVSAFNARYLSPAYVFTSLLIGRECDGMVSVESAYGASARIQDTRGARVPIQSLPGIQGELDHAKEILDYRLFLLVGEVNVGAIRDGQIRLFSAIRQATADRLF